MSQTWLHPTGEERAIGGISGHYILNYVPKRPSTDMVNKVMTLLNIYFIIRLFFFFFSEKSKTVASTSN